MNAGRLLRETGYDTGTLRACIAPVDPNDVNVYPASRLLRRFWRPGIKGVTHWKWVLVDPELLKGDRQRLARLVIHELVHVRQYREAGYVRFMAGYIWEYWRGRFTGKDGRQAYLDISSEVEARELTRKVISTM